MCTRLGSRPWTRTEPVNASRSEGRLQKDVPRGGLAFAVVHEMPEAAGFFTEAAMTMKPDARMLLAEPSCQVSEAEFDIELEVARRAGLELEARPQIRRTRTAVLRKILT